MLEPQLCKIERADEDVDRADRVVQPDIVLDPGRKQVGLLAAIAALERANRHKPNRTLKAPKCPSFLPSLDGTSEIFLREGLDDPNHIESTHEIEFSAHRFCKFKSLRERDDAAKIELIACVGQNQLSIDRHDPIRAACSALRVEMT